MKNGKVIHADAQRGIPLPPIHHRGSPKKYDLPIMTMKVGECFFVPCKDVHDSRKVRARLVRQLQLVKVTGRTFSTRLMPGDTRIGVWRTA